MIKFGHYARYEICFSKGSGKTLAYGTIKQEAFEFAQSEANRLKQRVNVRDSNGSGGKHYWQFIPNSEGAQGMRTFTL